MVYKAAEGGTPPFRKAIGREDIPPHCRKAMGKVAPHSTKAKPIAWRKETLPVPSKMQWKVRIVNP